MRSLVGRFRNFSRRVGFDSFAAQRNTVRYHSFGCWFVGSFVVFVMDWNFLVMIACEICVFWRSWEDGM